MSQPPAKRLFAVIEDDAAVLNSLQFALEAQGHEVCLFDRATDAIISTEIQAADCLLIDYALPDMDGLTMLAALRRRGLTAPAVIIASNPSARCREEAKKASAPLIEKPIMGETLNNMLLSILSDRA